MAPAVRRLGLTAHIVAAVGWLGGVVAFLALAVATLASRDPELVKAAYLAMRPLGWYVLLPLSMASLVTGTVQALGTAWGLARHYWVLFKLVINLLAAGVLLLYLRTLDQLADRAVRAGADELATLRDPSPVIHAAAAILVLLAATILAVHKPRGTVPTRWRALRPRPAGDAD